MLSNGDLEVILGREAELRQLRIAIQKRSSRLIWGPPDSGKTTLIRRAIAGLPEPIRKRCIYWSGAAAGRELASHFVRGLYEVGDALVRKRVHADGAAGATLGRWLQNQSVIRLRGILFRAAEQEEFWFFIDQLPTPNHAIAKLMKELINRCKTPVYLAGSGCTASEIGSAWSLFWTDEYRIRLGPLTDDTARELLEICIRRFGLNSFDLEGFREDILHLSGRFPGAIVKMCQLAADIRYHYSDQIKTKVIHVDYLMGIDRLNSWSAKR